MSHISTTHCCICVACIRRRIESVMIMQAYSSVQPTNLAQEKQKFLEQAADYEAGRRRSPPEDPMFEYAGLIQTLRLACEWVSTHALCVRVPDALAFFMTNADERFCTARTRMPARSCINAAESDRCEGACPAVHVRAPATSCGKITAQLMIHTSPMH